MSTMTIGLVRLLYYTIRLTNLARKDIWHPGHFPDIGSVIYYAGKMYEYSINRHYCNVYQYYWNSLFFNLKLSNVVTFGNRFHEIFWLFWVLWQNYDNYITVFISFSFLAPRKGLYESPCLSVRPSVCLSVREALFSMFLVLYHFDIFRNC